MNPISNHEIGQATHREYEATYGNRYSGEVQPKDFAGSNNRVKLFLAVSGSTAVAILAAISFVL